MDLAEVTARVDEIRYWWEVKDDDEVAHGKEDSLWEEVLEELSKDSELAKEALKTRELKFQRWCA